MPPGCRGAASRIAAGAVLPRGLHLARRTPPLALQNKRVVYGILFRAAAETLLEVAANPKHLGAEIGFLAVLHTWGQNLMHHPHVHCVVTGGGLSPDGHAGFMAGGASAVGRFSLPVKVLSRVFRGKFIQLLKQAFASGKLSFHGNSSRCANRPPVEADLNHAVRHELGRVRQASLCVADCVLKYLARYTHGVAISNRRLVALHDGQVSFRYKDYADRPTEQSPDLADTGIHPPLLAAHASPRFRADPLLRLPGESPTKRATRALPPIVGRDVGTDPSREEKALPRGSPIHGELCQRCPACQRGKLVIIEVVPPVRRLPATPPLHCSPLVRRFLSRSTAHSPRSRAR